MFNEKNIYTNNSNTRFLCNYQCSSAQEAKYIEASFLGSLHERYWSSNLYAKGSTLILDAPNLKDIKELIPLLNNSIRNMH